MAEATAIVRVDEKLTAAAHRIRKDPIVFGKPLRDLLEHGARPLCKDLESKVAESDTTHLRAIAQRGRTYNAIAHRSGDLIILETPTGRRHWHIETVIDGNQHIRAARDISTNKIKVI